MENVSTGYLYDVVSISEDINEYKNLLYGIKYSDNTYIILNTALEDISSVSYILRGQFIYITIIIWRFYK